MAYSFDIPSNVEWIEVAPIGDNTAIVNYLFPNDDTVYHAYPLWEDIK